MSATVTTGNRSVGMLSLTGIKEREAYGLVCGQARAMARVGERGGEGAPVSARRISIAVLAFAVFATLAMASLAGLAGARSAASTSLTIKYNGDGFQGKV